MIFILNFTAIQAYFRGLALYIAYFSLYYGNMTEYFTEALVLDKKDLGEADSLIYFYTEELGKVAAKAKSVKKIISKSNAHLEPTHFVKVRFVAGKNGNLQVIDALSCKKTSRKKIKNCPDKLAKYLRISNFINKMTPEFHQDLNLWELIKNIFSSDAGESKAYELILKESGLDPQYASCDVCRNMNTMFFYQTDQSFLCGNCVSPYRASGKNLVKIT